jgi:predicted ester cyclase
VEAIIQLHELINRGDVSAVADGFAEETRNHGLPVGREGVRQVLADIYRTFPDWRMEILELVTVDDTVVVRCRVSGTHGGVGELPVNGDLLVGVAPTRRRFEVQHIHWYKLRDSRIVDHYANRDDLGMMQQLGLLPAGGRPGDHE